MNAKQPSWPIRIKGDLPPTPALPASVQTLACRWMPLGLFDWCRQTLGDQFTLYPIDLPPVVFLSRPADIRAVLAAPSSVLRTGAGADAIRPIVGAHSFMLQEGEEHMHGRRTLLPAFNSAVAVAQTARVSETVRAEIASWPLDTPFPVFPRLRSMSLRIILNTIFGSNTGIERLHRSLLRMLDATASFVLVEPRLRHLPPWRGIWRDFIRARALVDEEIHRLIDSILVDTAGTGILDRLRVATNSDGSTMSPLQLRDNLVSVILAGHETTASEAAWALQLIAHAPHVQARLAHEIDAEGDEHYLNATVAEVLRHRPVFLFAIPRVVAQPLDIGGWTYRPPVQLLACIYLLHHDPRIHADPYSFRPERYLSARPEPSNWLPWGGGRKRCPGHRLATLELEAVIRTTLSVFTVLPASRRVERARWRSVIVTPARGSRIALTYRSARRSAQALK